MAAYLAMRIEANKLNYNVIVNSAQYGSYKDEIDVILSADNYIVNKDGTVTKQS